MQKGIDDLTCFKGENLVNKSWGPKNKDPIAAPINPINYGSF